MTADHGFMPGQFLRFFIVFQMFQLPLLKLAVEGFPLRVQFGLQRPELRFNRLLQKRDVHFSQDSGLFPFRYQFIRKMAVAETVIEVEFTRLKTLSYLAVEPELIPPGVQACGLAILAELQQIRAQPLR